MKKSKMPKIKAISIKIKPVKLKKLKATAPRKAKVEKVMHEFKEGVLHSGSKKGPKVKSRKQALAIALSEARRMKKR